VSKWPSTSSPATCADPTFSADHYYAHNIPPPGWAVGKTPAAKIGAHIFFLISMGA
jgi:spore germination cell wall hydrolase CwlJ-like protein